MYIQPYLMDVAAIGLPGETIIAYVKNRINSEIQYWKTLFWVFLRIYVLYFFFWSN